MSDVFWGDSSPFDEAAREVAETLADAAFHYLRLALTKLRERRADNVDAGAAPQVVAGVFGVALELMVKAAIAEQSVLALYKQIPSVVRVAALSSDPEIRRTVRADFVASMREGTLDMIDFAESVDCVLAMCPPVRQH